MIIKYKLPRDQNLCDHTMSRSDSSKTFLFDFAFVTNSCFSQVSKKELKNLLQLVKLGLDLRSWLTVSDAIKKSPSSFNLNN